MRLALLSDIHGNLPALQAVAALVCRRGVDRVPCLGDHLCGPLMSRETAPWLTASGWPMLAGKHEWQMLERTPTTGDASVVLVEPRADTRPCSLHAARHGRPDWAQALRTGRVN